jgi:hypothetical protein
MIACGKGIELLRKVRGPFWGGGEGSNLAL